MTGPHILSNIRKLNTVIGLLEKKWERPQTEIEASMLQTLRDIRIDLHLEYFEQTGLELPMEYEYLGSKIK